MVSLTADVFKRKRAHTAGLTSTEEEQYNSTGLPDDPLGSENNNNYNNMTTELNYNSTTKPAPLGTGTLPNIDTTINTPYPSIPSSQFDSDSAHPLNSSKPFVLSGNNSASVATPISTPWGRKWSDVGSPTRALIDRSQPFSVNSTLSGSKSNLSSAIKDGTDTGIDYLDLMKK